MSTRSGRPSPAAPEGVLHALLRAAGLLRQAQDPYFARFGISASQWGILRVLQRAELGGETDLPLKTVSERLLVQPPSVTGVADRLERLGLVQRSPSAADLRVRHLRLTPSGRDLLARVLQGHAARLQSLVAPLQPAERQTMLALLRRLEDHWKRLAASPPETAKAASRDPIQAASTPPRSVRPPGEPRRD
jgi:DNA-binding MarR family transcriptional regulator